MEAPAHASLAGAAAACEQELAELHASNANWMIGFDWVLLGSRELMLEHFFRGLDALQRLRRRSPSERVTVQRVWYLVEQQMGIGRETPLRGAPRCAYGLSPILVRAVGGSVRRFFIWLGEPSREALRAHGTMVESWAEQRLLLSLSAVRGCLQLSYDAPCDEPAGAPPASHAAGCARWAARGQAPTKLDHDHMFAAVGTTVGDGSAATRTWQSTGEADPDGF